MSKTKVDAEKIKNELWKTLQELRAGKIRTSNANAIAGQAREICRVVKLQLEFAKLSGSIEQKDIKKISL